MTVELTGEEMEIVLLALKDWVRQRQADGSLTVQETDLIARLEVVQWENRGASPPP